MSFSRDSCSDAAVAACPAGIALPTDSAREGGMYHCAMVDPKVLNAVAAVNAPLAYGPPPDAGLGGPPRRRAHPGRRSNPPADPAFAERFAQDDPLAAMSL